MGLAVEVKVGDFVTAGMCKIGGIIFFKIKQSTCSEEMVGVRLLRALGSLIYVLCIEILAHLN